MPDNIARKLAAIVVAPAVIAALFFFWESVTLGDRTALAPAYVLFSYLLGSPLALVAMVILQAAKLVRLWHFIIAGSVSGALASLAFLVRWPEASWAFIVIGPIVGAVVWFISEWQPRGIKSN